MNSKYNEIIKAYLNQTTTDFAIQIDGPWGGGKTYYIQNELLNVIQNTNKRPIYISLNGLEKLNDIDTRILLEVLKSKNKGKFSNLNPLASKIGDLWIEISPSFEKLNAVNKATGFITKFTNSKINLTEYVLILDDLERISGDLSISNLFGHIFDCYTSKNVKTIFVSNELEIKDEDYRTRKEKIIRRTISYAPSFSEQFVTFFKKKYPEKQNLLNFHKDFFISRLDKKGVRNLRTIAFIFDNFFEVINDINDELLKECFEQLFIDVLLLTDEYKLGKIVKEDLSDYKHLNDLGLAYQLKLKDKENKDTYATLFFQTYNQSNGLNFVFLKSIFDFIITGYLDKELLKQELNQIYNKYSEEEKAYRKLQDFLYLEEKEGKELVFKIIEYLNSGKFHLAIILKLYSSFKLIQERGYIENFNHNLEELFTNAIEESSKNIENIPMGDRFVMDDIVFDNSLKDDATYLKLSDLVREKAGIKQSNSQIDVIKTLFSDANSDSKYPERYEFGKLYNDIVCFKLEPLFFSLNNKGIAYFQSLLHNDVIGTKDPWQTDKISKSALEHIKSFIEDNIQNQEIDNMRKKRFSDFLDVMDKSIKALTEPNENRETN